MELGEMTFAVDYNSQSNHLNLSNSVSLELSWPLLLKPRQMLLQFVFSPTLKVHLIRLNREFLAVLKNSLFDTVCKSNFSCDRDKHRCDQQGWRNLSQNLSQSQGD